MLEIGDKQKMYIENVLTHWELDNPQIETYENYYNKIEDVPHLLA